MLITVPMLYEDRIFGLNVALDESPKTPKLKFMNGLKLKPYQYRGIYNWLCSVILAFLVPVVDVVNPGIPL